MHNDLIGPLIVWDSADTYSIKDQAKSTTAMLVHGDPSGRTTPPATSMPLPDALPLHVMRGNCMPCPMYDEKAHTKAPVSVQPLDFHRHE